MRMLRAAVVVGLLLTGVPMGGATPPDPPVCGGAWNLTVSAPMTLPGVGPATSASFAMTPTGTFCTGATSGSGNYPAGSLTGWCGAATGWGWLPDGRWFDIVWAGSSVTFVGAPVGSYTVVAAPECATTGGATSFLAVGAITASADACVGNGTMNVSPGLVSGTTRTVSFAFSSVVGLCALGGTFSAWGSMTGTCASAAGSAVANDGQAFDVTWIGGPSSSGRLLLTGNTVGIVHATANPSMPGNNCGSGLTDLVTSTQLAKLR